ncbi:MAG TPA: hypothetical protein VEU77_12010 [Candidatus Acidoferrales bacterium]|nr:hypothetical protein [Candidatus Acidoferrales bacterium]
MEQRVRKDLENRVARLEQQVRAFKTLHDSELGMILDELTAFRAELAAMAPPPSDAPAAPLGDPAANSPRRAAWLAEERRKEEAKRAPLSRREFLRGARDEEKPG